MLDSDILPLLAAPFMGSFLGVLIRRLPEGRAVAWTRSACEACGHVLTAREMIPLLSYAIQRGRCRACGAPIGAFHPLIEIAALAVAFSAWLVAPDIGWLWIACGLGWTLLALAWIDAEHLLLPDALVLPLILGGLAGTCWLEPDALLDHAVAAVAGWTILAAVASAYRRLRGRDGLGAGDAKMLAAAGAWLGLEALGPVLLGAALGGIALAMAGALRGARMTGATALPFGPPLALATWVVWLLAG